MRDYNEIQKAVSKKGYKFFTSNLDLNMIWERTSDIITNRFTDYLHVVYSENGIGKVLSIRATTKPGIKGSIDTPIKYQGITGTAVIMPGQYRGAWEFRDTDKEFSKYPYFRQVGAVDYWRDGNKDLVVDHVQKQQDKVFGTHWHKMSQVNAVGDLQVNNWSLGCMGASEPEFRKILPIVRASIPLYGARFTGTLLETKDFI